jgi:hypothetical protein
VAIADSSWFAAEDAVDGAPVAVDLEDGVYPIQSGLARVVADAMRLEVSTAPDSSEQVSRGQDDVTFLLLDFLNPDPGGLASDVRLGTFYVQVTDSSGAVVSNPGTVLDHIRVMAPFQELLDRSVTTSEDPTMELELNPILSVPVNSPVQLRIFANVAESAPIGKYRLKTGAASSFDARDANTGNPVPVLFLAGVPTGAEVTIEARAESLLVGGTARFPSSAPVGTHGLEAIALELKHPHAPGTARIRCDSLTVALRDDRGDPLSAAIFFDRVRVMRDGVEVGAVTSFPSGDKFRIPLANVIVSPGETANLSLLVDLEATAPASFLELSLDETSFHAGDVNLETAVAIDPTPGTEMPIRSGLLRIEAPARFLMVGFSNGMPPVLVPGGALSRAASLTMRNPAPLASSTLRVSGLRIECSDRSGAAIPVGAAARAISIVRDGVVWAERTGLAASDSTVMLQGAQELLVTPGETVALDIEFETADQPATESVRFGILSQGILVVQPASTLLEIQVQPEEQQSFPFWSATGNFSSADLRASYSNFPNPFAAGREETTFAFFLRESARVNLRILTVRGEEVITLMDGESLGPGLHQEETWNGRNGRGDSVVNGVYIADLEVRYADGSNARELRKVAVVR